MSNALTFNYGRVEELLGKPFDPVYAFLQQVPQLIVRAREIGARSAYSYRNVYVAGSIYGIDESEKTVWQETTGSVKRQGKEKVCFEKRALALASKTLIPRIIGMVILGASDRRQIESISGLATPTLHPCVVCRAETLAQHPAVSASTLAVTSGLQGDVNQVFSVGQLQRLYERAGRGDIDAALYESHSDFTDWEQRLARYGDAVQRLEGTAPSIDTRLGLAQLAMSGSLKI
ncbi:MAG TPA: hypothetical protein VF261_02655 [Candidatus Saccharimonadales bacterium]